MCGIIGFVQNTGRLNQENLENLTNTLAHRGPDASDTYFDSSTGVGLGHRRLSIIDLSSAANMPMKSHCGRYIMVYNGEVYNFKEIGAEIKKTNQMNFRTHSDSEVILEAFVLWGVDFVHKLNGMFAIAIWDCIESKLYLFRDRIGIKPLFYFKDTSLFFFGSELKSIQRLQKFGYNLEVNNDSINSYLHLGYIPAPATIYSNVYKFPQGHYGIVNKSGDVTINPYWIINNKVDSLEIADEQSAKARLRSLIESSVSYRMIADVPVGSFLSGGIDSSLVTAIASKKAGQKLKSFSIGFEESKFDESGYAKKVAEYIGTDHHSYILSEKEAMTLMESIIPTFDEPFADTSAIPTMLVSNLARKEVKVALTGDGGDEQFMGYGAYAWAKRLESPMLKITSKPLNLILQRSGNDRMRRVSHLFEKNRTGVRGHIFSQEQYLFSNNELSKLLINSNNYFSWNDPELKRSLDPESKQALFDLNYYLPDDLLVKVDRSSMKYGLECRVPLLDYRILEFTLNLSDNLKLKGKDTKWLLKQILYDHVPSEYFNRPKWGFSIPLVKWLKNDMSYLLEEVLSENEVNKQGIVKYAIVEKMKKDFFNGHDYLYNRLWALVLLHWWMKENNSHV